MHHAAVVIDTGDGNVRKLCLAFPEAEISGIEALQRVDTRPHRFETFDGKGSGVCMLCGVGCESGDCFCDRSRYWAYHRAGPGESRYQTSSVGASTTKVRDGDVEGWRWGTGAAPVKVSVSEVCGVAEPPARTGSSTATTSTVASAPTPTTVPGEPGDQTAGASPAPSPTSPPPAPVAPRSTPTTAASGAADGSTNTRPTPVSVPGEETVDEHAAPAAVPSGAWVEPRVDGPGETAAARAEAPAGTSPGELAGLAAFTALLGGLLVWRSRLRRAKVRRVRPVR